MEPETWTRLQEEYVRNLGQREEHMHRFNFQPSNAETTRTVWRLAMEVAVQLQMGFLPLQADNGYEDCAEIVNAQGLAVHLVSADGRIFLNGWKHGNAIDIGTDRWDRVLAAMARND